MQNTLKLILKSPRFVTFGGNVTEFGCQIWHAWCAARPGVPWHDTFHCDIINCRTRFLTHYTVWPREPDTARWWPLTSTHHLGHRKCRSLLAPHPVVIYPIWSTHTGHTPFYVWLGMSDLGLKLVRFEPKCTEIWSEKVPDLFNFGPIWPNV